MTVLNELDNVTFEELIIVCILCMTDLANYVLIRIIVNLLIKIRSVNGTAVHFSTHTNNLSVLIKIHSN